MSDKWIRKNAEEFGMISPFIAHKKTQGVLSYGLSSYGYDARLDCKFKIYSSDSGAIIDPKKFPSSCFTEHSGDDCIIPPNSFVLAKTIEYFRVPNDVMVLCVGKSTYARCGIITNVTPLEPGWEGYVTLEFANTAPLPARMYANEGACQFIFMKGDLPCETPYNFTNGKYMNQIDITLPKIRVDQDD